MTHDRSYGAVFDTVADQYDRHRPTYPAELVGHAVATGGLAPGDRVLEIGCGTGQLTRSLVARGLHVTAVEPGENLIALARQRVHAPGAVEFVHRRFEDAPPDGAFAAAFSASAFHWIDPEVSWDKVARSLKPGGVFALIQYSAVRDQRALTDDDALMDALARTAPAIAADWPQLRELEAFLAEAGRRRENVSELWAWVGPYPALARPYAAALFEDAEIAVAPMVVEHTADELNAAVRTTSLYHRLPPDQQRALEQANREIEAELGRPIRASMLAVLVTARRARRL